MTNFFATYSVQFYKIPCFQDQLSDIIAYTSSLYVKKMVGRVESLLTGNFF